MSRDRPMFDLLSSRKGGISILRTARALDALDREWRSIVGRTLAAHTRPRAFDGGDLVVETDGASAAIDFGFKKNAVLKVLREGLNIDANDIRIENGYGARRRDVDRAVPRPRRTPPVVDEADVSSERDEIKNENRDIDDDLAVVIARCRAAARAASS